LRPLAIDLFTGLHGWAHGLIAAGFDVIGVDLEDMSALLGEPRPDHFSLIIQDVLTLHGRQFKDAALIVASPPCQEYSYMAMPWTRAKAKAAAIRADTTGVALERLNRLFNACFRIQREACEAAGHHIPMVVENVRGAQPWVGRARWNFGSYYLWGDLPALMPPVVRRKNDELGGGSWFNIGSPGQTVTGMNPDGRKVAGFRFDGSGESFQSAAVAEHIKGSEGYERNHPNALGWKIPNTTSHGTARKAASAKIAKIPLTLAEWIGRAWLPVDSKDAGRLLVSAGPT
jgi:hypothetical protein